MTAKIINFADAKIRKRISQPNAIRGRGKYCSPVNKINCTATQSKETYQKEHAEFILNFNSMKTKYKHPTILSGYKKGINPVCALYENLQESLFKYDPDNDYCMWVIDLFRDRIWLAELISELEQDCRDITAFQKMHFGTDYTLESLYVLQNIKNNFNHYIYVFSIMLTWKH